MLRSFDLEKISEIIVETSRTNLYKESKPHKEIRKLLLDAGFYHNFNGSDFLLGHGDQYFSRVNKNIHFFKRFIELRARLTDCTVPEIEFLKRFEYE